MSDFEKKILEFKNRLNSTQDSKEIEAIRTDIFSKNGFINSQFKKLGSLSEDEKKTFASNINKAKQELLEIFRSKATEVSDKDLNEKIKKEKIDVTLPEKEFTALSIIGVNCLQGEHHGAQKSTITGKFSEALITFSTKSLLVTSMIWSVILK